MKTFTENIKPILAVIIIISAIGYYFTVTITGVKSDPEIKMAIFALASMAAGYYFGATSGTAKKDETIAELSKNQKQ